MDRIVMLETNEEPDASMSAMDVSIHFSKHGQLQYQIRLGLLAVGVSVPEPGINSPSAKYETDYYFHARKRRNVECVHSLLLLVC